MNLSGEEALIAELELQGYEKNTPQFARVLRLRKMEKCREYQGLPSCRACQKAAFCRLAEENRRVERELLDKR